MRRFLSGFLITFLFLQMTTGTAADIGQKGPSICAPEGVELFSCRLKSEKSVALCVGKRDLRAEFLFNDSDKGHRSFPLTSLKQIVGAASAGSSTILQGVTENGSATLFLDENTAEPSDSAIKIRTSNTEEVDFCVRSTIKTPVEKWNGPNNNWIGGSNIYGLILMGLAKPFSLSPQEEGNLWRSWPRESNKT